MMFDKNKDGQLSYSEFLSVMNDRVNRGFKNQTGKLAGTGLRAFKRCLIKEISIN
jgi:Ca2+-binding EF-hand superfamily protein